MRAVKLHEVRSLQHGEREAFETQPFPPDQHDVILLDPPWFYAKDNGMFRPNPGFHYSMMKDEELAALPVNMLGKKNPMMFMWATGLTLHRALNLMAHYGYEYVSSGVWVKTRGNTLELSHVPGLGPMLMTHEYILIGRKGKGLGKTNFQPRSVFFAPGGAGQKNIQHSRKPEVIYEWIEKMWPSTRKIELFARSLRDGWKAWGNEAPKLYPVTNSLTNSSIDSIRRM